MPYPLPLSEPSQVQESAPWVVFLHSGQDCRADCSQVPRRRLQLLQPPVPMFHARRPFQITCCVVSSCPETRVDHTLPQQQARRASQNAGWVDTPLRARARTQAKSSVGSSGFCLGMVSTRRPVALDRCASAVSGQTAHGSRNCSSRPLTNKRAH